MNKGGGGEMMKQEKNWGKNNNSVCGTEVRDWSQIRKDSRHGVQRLCHGHVGKEMRVQGLVL
jgi:hypothetical protein